MNATASNLRGPAVLLRWGRAAAMVVVFLSVLTWVGWVTGIQVLTKVHPAWPLMMPWTALWLAALAVAIVLQSGYPSRAGVRLARGLALAVGVVAALVLAEYATGRTFGVDQVWFGDAVRTVQLTWPGRPSPQTAMSVLVLSLGIGLTTVQRRWAGTVRTLSWVAAMTAPAITSLAYLFGAVSLFHVTGTVEMALTTALGLLLLGAAAALTHPERGLFGWLLGRPDRHSLLQLAAIIAGFPIFVGVSRLALVTTGFGDLAALTFATAVGTGVVGLIMLRLSQIEQRQREIAAEARTKLRASYDSMLDPQVLLEAVRDSGGRVVDFRYVMVNRAACTYLGLEERDLVGQTQREDMPNLEGSEFHRRYIQCLQDGQPVILDDSPFFNEILDDARRYDVRATKAGADLLSVTWRDVTNRHLSEQRLAESEEHFRLLAENSTDIVCHVRDAAVVWVSPSIEAILGAPPDYWLGQEVFAHVPPEDVPQQVAVMAAAVGGSEIKHRGRVLGLDGVAHWFDLRAKPFLDTDGRPDGVMATLRSIDAEVAAEQVAEEARRLQARADVLYRRSIDNAAVGMCLADLEGHLIESNHAMCEFFGYDDQTLRHMTWQQLTDPDYLEADLDNRAQVLAGDIDSYRMVKRFIHADGHPIWGDLSVSCIRDASGQVEMFIGQITDITAEVRAREQLEHALREKAKADALYRLAMNNSAVGMCLATPEGRPQEVNEALCRFFGYDAQTLMEMDWQKLTQPEYLTEESANLNALLEGRIDSYRMIRHYIRADGDPIWGDLSVSALRGEDGQVQNIYAVVTDITARMEADEWNRVLAQQLQQETERVRAELHSAAAYMESIMPRGLEGRVKVSSRYLPSQQLGGDCLDYYWLDDDRLVVKLIDVSGHGLEPALLAVSVHNLMRSGSLSRETLLSPEAVLAELNRLFAMEDQNDHYITMWYGIYQASTRTLRYASAGAPPALAFNSNTDGSVAVNELSTPAAPIGMFDDTEFTSQSYLVPPGCRILIHSDGASEIALGDGSQLSLPGFANLIAILAQSPNWSLDEVIDELQSLGSSEHFEDDCSLIRLAFD